jgi:hypothetical protein
MFGAFQLQMRRVTMSNPQPSIILLASVCLLVATTSFAEEAPTPLSPQFQRENLELKQRQSQASQGLKLDAGERLDLYDLEMRQRREQQQLQERQRQQLEVQDRRDTAGDAGRLNQQHILQRQRDQQMQSFRRELDQWRAKQQNPGRSQ